MFDNYIKAGLDPEKEERSRHLNKLWFVGFVLWVFYLLLGGHFATQAFQGGLATLLYYCDEFYVSHPVNLRETRVWRAILATVPFHCAYLAVLFWLDHVLPQVMPKAIVFMPVVVIGFVAESSVLSKLVNACLGEQVAR